MTTNSVITFGGGGGNIANANFLTLAQPRWGAVGSTILWGNFPNWLGNEFPNPLTTGRPHATLYGMADVGEFYRPYELHSRLGRDYPNHVYIASVNQSINQVDDIRVMVWDNLTEELWYA